MYNVIDEDFYNEVHIVEAINDYIYNDLYYKIYDQMTKGIRHNIYKNL